MKNNCSILMLVAMLIATNFMYAQAPNSFNYQAVLRDGSGNLITSGITNMRFTIHTGTATGTIQYQETKDLTPNQFGLVNHAVGTGLIQSGTMNNITWGTDSKFLQVEANTGNGYVDLGTQQLVSVPYAISSGDKQWAKSGNDISNLNSGLVGVGTNNPKHRLDVKGNIFLGTARSGDNFTPIEDVLYLGSGRKFLANTTGVAVDGSKDWINLMAHPFSKGILLGTSGSSDTTPHTAVNALMVVKSNGNVGIGTVNPLVKLHIESSNAEILRLNGGGSSVYMTIAEGGTYRGYIGSYSGAAADVDFGTGGGNLTGSTHLTIQGTPRLTVTSNGRVGIGTTAPDYPLHVASNVSATIGGWFHEYTSSTLFYNNGAVGVGICANANVYAPGFLAASDARIKKDIERSITANDLSTINRLKVTNYMHIDRVEKDRNLQKGFIAQEVYQVIPEAITKLTDFVPSIYAVAEKVETLADGRTVITTKKPHELKKNDEVRLITATKNDYKVENVMDAYRFEVSGLPATTQNVFVYGKKVDDFNVVNYDRIFTTGIGAIQELSKQVEALKVENTSLKAELVHSNTANASLKTDVEAIKAQLGIRSQNTTK